MFIQYTGMSSEYSEVLAPDQYWPFFLECTWYRIGRKKGYCH